MSVIQLIAPSGYCLQQHAAERGIARLEAAGHQVLHREAIPRRFQRFAGTEAERRDEINALSNAPVTTDIILAVRGGYGMSRLLPGIHYQALKKRMANKPLLICGHSDFTALQLALLAEQGIVTFSGPMLAGNFGAEALDDFTWHHFWTALSKPRFTINWSGDGPACHVQGTVWGGNLAMLNSLIGTPWMPDICGGILIVEDINEHTYRIERMLLQLLYSGVLERQQAIILGSFSGSTVSEYDAGYDFHEMCHYLRQRLDVPLISGLPFGHGPQTVTLPLGAQGLLDYDGVQARLTLSDYPILQP